MYLYPDDNVDKSYRVRLTIEDGVTKFSCNCNNVYKDSYNIRNVKITEGINIL